MTPQQFIEKNISTEPYNAARFYLRSLDYPLKCENLPDYMISQAKLDLHLFDTREKERLKYPYPLVGDAILRKDGRKTFIGLFNHSGKFQDTSGGSFHLSGNSHMSYSGGFTLDVLHVNSLIHTRELCELWCWIFSGDISGGNRGVYNKIRVKTWKEI